MAPAGEDDDVRAIRALIGDHFRGLRWSPATRPDWDAFTADFLPDAALFPAARPVRRQTLEAFIARMNGFAQGTLRSFEETTLGMQIHVFGNVAVVMAASEMVENGSTVNQDVGAYLLLKDAGAWRIAAHAWDHAVEVETKRAHAALAALGAGCGTRAQAALRFALANPDLACVVIGLGEPSYLEEATAAEAMGPLPAEAIAKLEAVYARGLA